ncbi:MAG: hypothetical protein WCP18_00310 [bacterium]
MACSCEEKKTKVELFKNVLDTLPEVDEKLHSPDRDIFETGYLGSAERESWRLLRNHDLIQANDLARRQLMEAQKLCDACGKDHGSFYCGENCLCTVCYLSDGFIVLARLEMKSRQVMQSAMAT